MSLDGKQLNEMTVQQLRTALRARSMPTAGAKAELVARLSKAFEEKEKEEAEGDPEMQPPAEKRRAKEADVLLSDEQRAKIESKRAAAVEIRRKKEAEAATTEAVVVEVAAESSEERKGELAHFPTGQWKDALEAEFAKPYFQQLLRFVLAERAAGKTVLPPAEDVFAAFRSTPLDRVKVVIIGQDPYFHRGEAHGLCFSVRPGVKVPPSLNRIYNVLEKTVKGFKKPRHGHLVRWAEQGVFMLNATLTVEEGKPNSHEKAGWQQFTDAVIGVLNSHCSGVVYMLWGGFAQKKGKLVDAAKNHILSGPHPSPMSGSAWNETDHFAEANRILVAAGKTPIDWQV